MVTASQSLSGEPVVRLRLAPSGAVRRRIDGAWWPHSHDLLTELLFLLQALPCNWGIITSVTVNGAMWPALPSRMLVANQVVRVHRSRVSHAPDTICLLAPGKGRWDLLVVPPGTPEEDAEPLMAAAADDRG